MSQCPFCGQEKITSTSKETGCCLMEKYLAGHYTPIQADAELKRIQNNLNKIPSKKE